MAGYDEVDCNNPNCPTSKTKNSRKGAWSSVDQVSTFSFLFSVYSSNADIASRCSLVEHVCQYATSLNDCLFFSPSGRLSLAPQGTLRIVSKNAFLTLCARQT